MPRGKKQVAPVAPAAPVAPVKPVKKTKQKAAAPAPAPVPVPEIKAASKKIVKKTASQKSKASAKTKASTVSQATNEKEPAKPLSSYAIFLKQMSAQMKNMPKFNDLTLSERAKVISESWSKLSAEQKKQYVEMANTDKTRYNNEVGTSEQLTQKSTKSNKSGKKVQPKEKKKTAKEIKAEEKKKAEELKAKEKKAADDKKAKEDLKAAEKKKKDETVTPKKVLTAFIYFGLQNAQKIKAADPEIKITGIAKQNGADWGKLTEEQKQPFVEQSKKDAERYEKENTQLKELGYFINSDGIKSTMLSKKHKELEFPVGTVMPKKELTPYTFFFKEYYEVNKESCKGRSPGDIARSISAEWSALASKKKFEDLTKKDKARYDNQIAQLKKNGFFLTADGTKSTDLPIKKPKVKRVKKTQAEEEQK